MEAGGFSRKRTPPPAPGFRRRTFRVEVTLWCMSFRQNAPPHRQQLSEFQWSQQARPLPQLNGIVTDFRPFQAHRYGRFVLEGSPKDGRLFPASETPAIAG